MKVMSAIERCRTAALGGHVARCKDCAHTVIAYNSCRNRHCPKCQSAAAKAWLAAREADLLPVGYFHVVFTLPAAIADIPYQNKAAICDILFTASAETVATIAADPKHLGARIGITSVLHTWGSALTHHPHVHMIVPGGGISADGSRWISSRPNFLVHVKVLARLFRGKFLAMLIDAHSGGRLKFFNTHIGLADKRTFKKFLAPLRRTKWVVYCKEPFAGLAQVLRYLSRYTHRVAISSRMLREALSTVPRRFRPGSGSTPHDAVIADPPPHRTKWVVYCKEPFAGPAQVLRYLSRYTHRVAISNRRLIAADDSGVSFRWKDYRIEGPSRWKTMTLTPHEFIRRFLMHVLPKGFHRIRHYGLFASANRAANIAKARELLAVPARSEQPDTPEAPAADEPRMLPRPCPCCGGRMFIIETFARGCEPNASRSPQHRPTPVPARIRIDTS
jgi:Putative transposase/Transposase zinc-binding domain